MARANLSLLFACVLLVAVHALVPRLTRPTRSTLARLSPQREPYLFRLHAEEEQPRGKEKGQRVVGYDNVGDPIFDGDASTGYAGLNTLFDPLNLTLLGFGIIAFNFFVLANL